MVQQAVTAKQLAEMRERGYRADSGEALEDIGVIDQADEAFQPRASGIKAITFTNVGTGESVTLTAETGAKIDRLLGVGKFAPPSESQFGEDDDFIPSAAHEALRLGAVFLQAVIDEYGDVFATEQLRLLEAV